MWGILSSRAMKFQFESSGVSVIRRRRKELLCVALNWYDVHHHHNSKTDFPSFEALKHKQNHKRFAIVKIAIARKMFFSFRVAVEETIRLLLISLIGMYCLPFFILMMETFAHFFSFSRATARNIKHFSERSENVFEETITTLARRINRFVNAINWMCVRLDVQRNAMPWQCL